MSKREDIETGGLIYTCNCGWIDRGHANPKGAKSLLEQIRSQSANPIPGESGFEVTYGQSMGKWGLSAGQEGSYYVPYGLNESQQNAVGLGIFQEVSTRFETMQGNYSYFTDSGFSQEDLVSNLVGYHAAARGEKADDLIKRLCKPVSKETAYKMWDRYGALGDAKNKNKTWKPVIHTCEECAKECAGEPRTFPKEFGDITPAKKGVDYFDWHRRPK
jgi:hypothetical protein